MMELDKIVPVLQLSIGPVIVISGVGLVLLSMTNRFGRVIDRARSLAESLRSDTKGATHHHIQGQLQILTRRAALLRYAISFASASMLLSAFLVIALFLVALLNLHAVALIIIIFISSMVSLIIGLSYFLVDVNASLTAFEIETDVG